MCNLTNPLRQCKIEVFRHKFPIEMNYFGDVYFTHIDAVNTFDMLKYYRYSNNIVSYSFVYIHGVPQTCVTYDGSARRHGKYISTDSKDIEQRICVKDLLARYPHNSSLDTNYDNHRNYNDRNYNVNINYTHGILDGESTIRVFEFIDSNDKDILGLYDLISRFSGEEDIVHLTTRFDMRYGICMAVKVRSDCGSSVNVNLTDGKVMSIQLYNYQFDCEIVMDVYSVVVLTYRITGLLNCSSGRLTYRAQKELQSARELKYKSPIDVEYDSDANVISVFAEDRKKCYDICPLEAKGIVAILHNNALDRIKTVIDCIFIYFVNEPTIDLKAVLKSQYNTKSKYVVTLPEDNMGRLHSSRSTTT